MIIIIIAKIQITDSYQYRSVKGLWILLINKRFSLKYAKRQSGVQIILSSYNQRFTEINEVRNKSVKTVKKSILFVVFSNYKKVFLGALKDFNFRKYY